MTSDDQGVLVLRVWEQGGEPVARMLTRSGDGFAPGVGDLGAFAGEDAIIDAVRSWLRSVVGGDAPATGE